MYDGRVTGFSSACQLKLFYYLVFVSHPKNSSHPHFSTFLPEMSADRDLAFLEKLREKQDQEEATLSQELGAMRPRISR